MVTSNAVYLVIACLSWKQHATVNYVRPRGYSMYSSGVGSPGCVVHVYVYGK